MQASPDSPDTPRVHKLALYQALREKARRNAREGFLPYVLATTPGYMVNFHHREIAETLEAVVNGDLEQVMFKMPPRHGKTLMISQRFPAWVLGRLRNFSVISASYGDDLATRAGRINRNLIDGPDHNSIWPECGLHTDGKAAHQFYTTNGGEYRAVSTKGGVTGFGYNGGIVDDPTKGSEAAESERQRDVVWDWWQGDFVTRGMPWFKDGKRMNPWRIVVGTPWHEDDLLGRILNEETSASPWHVVEYPAINEREEALWPDMYPIEYLRKLQLMVGPRQWQALYQLNPTPESGVFFDREWLWTYKEAPKHLRIYAASDYAVTAEDGDYTVHIVVGVDPNGIIYVLDCWRKQATSDKWVEAALELGQRWKPVRWFEEGGQIEKSVGPFLTKRQMETGIRFPRKQFTSSVDKPTRAQSIAGFMALHQVRFPENAPWWPAMRSELLKFPFGMHDDMVDTLSLIGRGLLEMRAAVLPSAELPTKGLNVQLGGNGIPEQMTYDDLLKLDRRL